MNKLALCIATLPLAVLPLAGLAQEAANQRIEITATRYDVRMLCPAIEDDLRKQLARRLSMLPAEALVQVAFQLDGNHISGIETRGSSFDARRVMRQAVQQIGCDNGAAGRQRVRVDISYRFADDAPHGATAAQHKAPTVAALTAAR